jgi:hypothetical protein
MAIKEVEVNREFLENNYEIKKEWHGYFEYFTHNKTGKITGFFHDKNKDYDDVVTLYIHE